MSPFLFAFTPPASPAVTTPQAVANYIVQVNGEIEDLSNDIAVAMVSGKVTVSDDFAKQRNNFMSQWNWFVGNYLSTGWITTLAGDAWDQVGQYQSKNEVWREKFHALGGASTGPGPQEIPKSENVISGAVKWGSAAVLAAAAAFVFYEVRK